jgi:hypothetical protein
MTRAAALLTLLVSALLLLSCASTPPKPASAGIQTSYRFRRLPPEPKEIVSALLASSQVPLSVSETCAGVGADPADTTIGQFVGAFLAELDDPQASNRVTTSAVEDTLASGEKVWICRVLIRHAKGDDIWSWGVEFSVQASDNLVLANSFRCLGAG